MSNNKPQTNTKISPFVTETMAEQVIANRLQPLTEAQLEEKRKADFEFGASIMAGRLKDEAELEQNRKAERERWENLRLEEIAEREEHKAKELRIAIQKKQIEDNRVKEATAAITKLLDCAGKLDIILAGIPIERRKELYAFPAIFPSVEKLKKYEG